MDENIRATTVRLKVGTLEWLKVEAVRRRVSASEVVEQLVEQARATNGKEVAA